MKYLVSILIFLICNLCWATAEVPKPNPEKNSIAEDLKSGESQLESNPSIAENFKSGKSQLKKNPSVAEDLKSGESQLEKNPSLASFDFERVLLQQPNNVQAHIGMARANIKLKQYEMAKVELNSALKAHPTSLENDQIQVLLERIAAITGEKPKPRPQANTNVHPEERPGIKNKFYAGAGVGYDSNVNSATASNTIFIPGFLPLVLNQHARQFGSSYINGKIGVDGSWIINKCHAFFWNLNALPQQDFRAPGFSPQLYNFLGGYLLTYREYTFRFPVTYQKYYLQGDVLLNTYSGGINISRPIINDRNSIAVTYEAGGIYYPTQQINNVNTQLATLSWLYLTPDKHTQFIWRGLVAHNTARYAAKDFSGAKYYGLLFGVKHKLTPCHTPRLNLLGIHYLYDAPLPVFNTRRDENFVLGILGWDWDVTRQLLVSFDYVYTKNNSNLALYAFNRQIGQMSFTYTFC